MPIERSLTKFRPARAGRLRNAPFHYDAEMSIQKAFHRVSLHSVKNADSDADVSSASVSSAGSLERTVPNSPHVAFVVPGESNAVPARSSPRRVLRRGRGLSTPPPREERRVLRRRARTDADELKVKKSMSGDVSMVDASGVSPHDLQQLLQLLKMPANKQLLNRLRANAQLREAADAEEIPSPEEFATATTQSVAGPTTAQLNQMESQNEDPVLAQNNVMAAGITRVPEKSSEDYLVAELHEYDLATCSYKSPCQLIRIKIEKKSFQEGAMRRAYKAEVLERPDQKFVVKEYISAETTENFYYKDVQMQTASGFYAQEMNKSVQAKLASPELRSTHARTLEKCYPLSFTDSFIIKIISTGKLLVGELFIEGKYVKFNNNWGYVAEQGDFANDYAQAFSHFTFEHSNGEMLICDIQGGEKIYTDPQIHTADPAKGFGQGNMGLDGIKKFKETHTCGRVCQALHLTPFEKSVKKSTKKSSH